MVGEEDKQKSTEIFYVRKFLVALQMEVDSIEGGADPPDLILSKGKERIAVEVTEFHSDAIGSEGHPRRLIEEEWTRLQKSIEQEREHYPDLNEVLAVLFFKKLALPSRPEYGQFIRELLEFSQFSLKSISRKGVDFTSFGKNFSLLINNVFEEAPSSTCRLLCQLGMEPFGQFGWVERTRIEKEHFEKVEDSAASKCFGKLASGREWAQFIPIYGITRCTKAQRIQGS